tara:strand:- start:321 stop:896 length:576 start_codon:yes stop_codon:yes gene_type:complete
MAETPFPSTPLGNVESESDLVPDGNVMKTETTLTLRDANRNKLVKVSHKDGSPTLGLNDFLGDYLPNLDDRRAIAASNGRTLEGLAMEWVVSCAEYFGAKKITVTDLGRWDDKKEMAATALNVRRMLDLADRVTASTPDSAQDYLMRVKDDGYYGQWGFAFNKKAAEHSSQREVKLANYKKITAGFVDMCV